MECTAHLKEGTYSVGFTVTFSANIFKMQEVMALTIFPEGFEKKIFQFTEKLHKKFYCQSQFKHIDFLTTLLTITVSQLVEFCELKKIN